MDAEKKDLQIRCACGNGVNFIDAFKRDGELRKADRILLNVFRHCHTGALCKVETFEVPTQQKSIVPAPFTD